MRKRDPISAATDEMIVAGSDVVSDFWVRLTGPASDMSVIPEIVEAVYDAMEQARVSPKPWQSPHRSR
jgi:hypothetical protein